MQSEKALTKGLQTVTIKTIATRMSKNLLQAAISANFRILIILKKLCT
jgi:hypothetical protein